MGLIGILLALGLLIWLAYRGWSVLLLAPAMALVAAAVSREALLAYWTQTFMGSAAQFVGQPDPGSWSLPVATLLAAAEAGLGGGNDGALGKVGSAMRIIGDPALR